MIPIDPQIVVVLVRHADAVLNWFDELKRQALDTIDNKGRKRLKVQPFVPSDDALARFLARFGSKAATFSRTAIAIAACFSVMCV